MQVKIGLMDSEEATFDSIIKGMATLIKYMHRLKKLEYFSRSYAKQDRVFDADFLYENIDWEEYNELYREVAYTHGIREDQMAKWEMIALRSADWGALCDFDSLDMFVQYMSSAAFAYEIAKVLFPKEAE